MTTVLPPALAAASARQAPVPQATPPAGPSQVTMAAALNRALAADDRVVVFGEDVGTLGGVFRVTDGLAGRFGEHRVFDTPLAESGIVGTAIGMAMNGLVPVVEMQFDAFAYPAFEQVTSHLAKLRNRTRGRVALPVVIRVPCGGVIGGVLHPHAGTAGGDAGHPRGRLPAAAGGDPLPRPGRLPRAEAALLVEGDSRPDAGGSADRPRGRAAGGQ